jgi:hypothetical protein
MPHSTAVPIIQGCLCFPVNGKGGQDPWLVACDPETRGLWLVACGAEAPFREL